MSDGTQGLSRRAFLRGCSAAALAVPLAALTDDVAIAAAPSPPGVVVRPRSDWAAGLPAPGPLEREQPGDVRFLIVHHSASSNEYAQGDVAQVLRGFHAFHTGPDKGWPDVAYNFFVDRYGVIWEGRTGSLTEPVKPDATGGSQGFSQICCFIGDHTAETPTAEAQRSMTLLLAGLAELYGIDPSPGAMTSFVSRGSNKWPAGTSVTTSTIAGHRDMSLTTCPGDAAYSLVRQSFPIEVAAVLAARATPMSPSPSADATDVPSLSTKAQARTSSATGTDGSAASIAAADDGGVDASTLALVGGGLAAGAAVLGLVQHEHHRNAVAETPDDGGGASRNSPNRPRDAS